MAPVATRPVATGNADADTARNEPLGADGTKVNSNFCYGLFDVSEVENYNQWPAGLEKRSGYTAQMTDVTCVETLLSVRPRIYSARLTLALGGFDSSPIAMVQGPTRRARGEAFVRFLADSFGAKPNVMIVSECGHNDRCIFTTNEVFPAIVP